MDRVTLPSLIDIKLTHACNTESQFRLAEDLDKPVGLFDVDTAVAPPGSCLDRNAGQHTYMLPLSGRQMGGKGSYNNRDGVKHAGFNFTFDKGCYALAIIFVSNRTILSRLPEDRCAQVLLDSERSSRVPDELGVVSTGGLPVGVEGRKVSGLEVPGLDSRRVDEVIPVPFDIGHIHSDGNFGVISCF